MSFDWKPSQNPAEETQVIKMAKWIEGETDPFDMKMKLVARFGHRDGGGWMGIEAIKREGIRATLFDKEKANASAQ